MRAAPGLGLVLVLATACNGGSGDAEGTSAATVVTTVHPTVAGSTGPATTSATTGADGTTAGSTGETTSSETSTSTTTSTTTSISTSEATGDASTGPDTCVYELVFEQPGELLTVTYDNSLFSIKPLPEGASFYCMRIEYDLQTADSFEKILMDFEGCPIYTGVSGLRGTPKQTGKALANILFKDYMVGCEPGPDRLEIDTFVDSALKHGPWPMGGLYHFEVTVEPFTSRVRIFQGGEQLGEAVEASIAGATLDDARDPVVELGMSGPADGAYFPNYDGVYSNLQIWAEVAL